MKKTLLLAIIIFLTGACAPRIAKLEKQMEVEHQEKARLLEKIDNMDSELDACKTINQNLTENLQKLSGQSQKLKENLNKQKSVLHLQNQVIKLLDDTKKSIESSLKDQISAMGIEIKQSEDQLKVVLVDQVLFDSGSVDIKGEGKKNATPSG